MIEPYFSKPKPTVGHHFSDLFSCPLRAWLHYYGNPKDQVEDPAYLKALYREGLEYEQEVYREYFPEAYKIPNIRDKRKRLKYTLEAMERGEKIILQGYLFDDEREGVLDILELIGQDGKSKTGHIYQVGEIKRSAKLYTAHVLQAAWYTEMLSSQQTYNPERVKFYLKGGGLKTILLQDYIIEYEMAKRELMKLRMSKSSPEPFFIKECTSCHWRGLCMPELTQREHLSLIPWITKDKAKELEKMGIRTWKNFQSANDEIYQKLGLTEFEISQIKHAIQCLDNGNPPLIYPLKKDIFKNGKVVVLEIPDIAEQRREGNKLQPNAIYFEKGFENIETLKINEQHNEIEKEIAKIQDGSKLIFYGSTDVNVFRQICKSNGQKMGETIDVFDIVDEYVHSPVPGIELNALAGFISNRKYSNKIGIERVRAIRSVMNWIEKSL